MVRQRGKNTVFVRCVESLYVCGGIRFGIAEFLRLFKARFVIRALVAHFGQNIVGSAVDNAFERGYAVCLHRVGKRANHGNAAHATRLEIESRAALFCGGFEFVPAL